MDKQKRRQQWQWVVSLVLVTGWGLVALPRVDARTTCNFTDTSDHVTPPLVLVDTQVAYTCSKVVYALSCQRTEPSTTTVRLRLEFLDSQSGQAAWKFWFRIDNPAGSPTKAAKVTATINNKTCAKGPYTLVSGGFVTSSCLIDPEPSPTGLYTVVITTDKDTYLTYNYLLCQEN